MRLTVGGEFVPDKYVLKLNKDNTISIKKPKSSWTKEEVSKLCVLAYNLRTTDKEVRSTYEINKWIEENL